MGAAARRRLGLGTAVRGRGLPAHCGGQSRQRVVGDLRSRPVMDNDTLPTAMPRSARGGISMAIDTTLGVATGRASRPDEGFELTGPGTSPGQLLREMWASRQLIAVLARKDFLVRCRRTSLGLIWAVALPAIQAIVLAV